MIACTMAWPRYHISTNRTKTSFSTMSATLVEKIQNTRRQRLHEKKNPYMMIQLVILNLDGFFDGPSGLFDGPTGYFWMLRGVSTWRSEWSFSRADWSFQSKLTGRLVLGRVVRGPSCPAPVTMAAIFTMENCLSKLVWPVLLKGKSYLQFQ